MTEYMYEKADTYVPPPEEATKRAQAIAEALWDTCKAVAIREGALPGTPYVILNALANLTAEHLRMFCREGAIKPPAVAHFLAGLAAQANDPQGTLDFNDIQARTAECLHAIDSLCIQLAAFGYRSASVLDAMLNIMSFQFNGLLKEGKITEETIVTSFTNAIHAAIGRRLPGKPS